MSLYGRTLLQRLPRSTLFTLSRYSHSQCPPRIFHNGPVRSSASSLRRKFSVSFASQAKVEAAEEIPKDDEDATQPVEGAPASFSLRPYQREAITACIEALSAGVKRMGVSSPTGSGKTTMFMHLIPQVIEPDSEDTSSGTYLSRWKRKQTLVLVNGIELAQQAYNAAKRLLPEDWTVEIEQGKKHASGTADVTIATYQTLMREGRLTKFDADRCGLIIVDEAHHSASHSYLRLLHHFNRDVKLPDAVDPIESRDHERTVPIVGFTATFSRNDHMALSDVYQQIVYHREVQLMLEEGWLCPAKLTTIEADLSLGDVEVNPKSGDFSTTALARHLDTPEVRDLVLRTYLHKAESRRSTLIFCTNLAHVDHLKQTFRNAGVDARSVSSLLATGQRAELIRGFSDGEFPVLINCEVLTEGTDIPQIDCVILARPTKSRNLLIQMIGRGLRQSPASGKSDCHIIDLVDNVSQGITASPTLLGLSQEDVAGKPRIQKEDGEEKAEDSEEDGPQLPAPEVIPSGRKINKVTMVDLDDPFGIKEPGFRPLAQLSENAWVTCRYGVFVLDLFNAEYLKIEQVNPPLYEIRLTQPMIPNWVPNSIPYQQSKVLGEDMTLSDALARGDAYVVKKYGLMGGRRYQRVAKWRFMPAHEKALERVWKIKGLDKNDSIHPSERKVKIGFKEIPLGQLTAGQASAVVTAAKHGASTRFKQQQNKANSAVKRARAIADKDAALAARNLPLPPSTKSDPPRD
ncbi:P-loop containing nucleoside triphosphate hydrolase protein [Kockovaella imperatae]|uniref:p-loop containing nucleoside triphosphate hydrolase protein n=1 Tax=Kockovaella imperatae TaxID=4999 RepID=A0A1Y1UEE5_9TREE|nr:P-loop containing nucleoside triphosphate hydrolase protein [Kockovaella imperatae]ORX36359.1 P-loop containing nucleoside triphosphate hydrolase protein [Kockovaella imperatae]